MAVTAANVRPLTGAILRQYNAGGSVTVGNSVYIAADGDVEQSDANLAASAASIGIIVAVGDTAGLTTASDGDAVTVCTFGPVAGFSSLNEAALQYVSETAGAITETAPSGAGTWTHVVGYAEDDDVLFVQPGVAAPTSNS